LFFHFVFSGVPVQVRAAQRADLFANAPKNRKFLRVCQGNPRAKFPLSC